MLPGREIIAARGADASCGGFGFARNSTTFDIVNWLQAGWQTEPRLQPFSAPPLSEVALVLGLQSRCPLIVNRHNRRMKYWEIVAENLSSLNEAQL